MNHLPAPCSKLLSHPGLPLSALLGLTWLAPCPAVGYVGPGAGFALAGGLWTALVVGIAALTLMILPLRLLLIWWRRKKNRGNARTDRVVVIGLDGLGAASSKSSHVYVYVCLYAVVKVTAARLRLMC